MRTTITIDDALLAEVKQVAARTGRTLTAVVEDALRESLSRRRRHGREPVELSVFGEGGLQPGVDLDDGASLLDLMERHDPAPGDAPR
jgi:hypothetical protein